MERYKRQEAIIRPIDMREPIHVIGAGGIGSWATLLLAKMGCENITVYDNDTVEDHNVASQFFKEEQLGMLKVEALRDNVLEQTGVEINAVEDIAEEETIPGKVILMCLDSMEERIRLGAMYADRDIYIIDGRMGGLSFEIFCGNSLEYLSSTVPPENVEHDACTAKSICFNCAVIAGLMVNQVRIFLTDSVKVTGIYFFDMNTMMLIHDVKKIKPVANLSISGATSIDSLTWRTRMVEAPELDDETEDSDDEYYASED